MNRRSSELSVLATVIRLNETYFPFTAFDETGAVGFFTLRQPGGDPDELSFGYVIVSPAARGKGYGKQMLRSGIKFAFELYGVSKVSLEVFEKNPDAFYCYRSVGFRENGNFTTYDLCGEKWKSIEMEIVREIPGYNGPDEENTGTLIITAVNDDEHKK